MTPLLMAIERSDTLLVRALLSKETEPPGRAADPDKGSGPGSVSQAPLLYAVARSRGASIVESLLEAGANCAILVASSKRPKEADNLLDIARDRRDYDTLQLLLEYPDCDVHLDDLVS